MASYDDDEFQRHFDDLPYDEYDCDEDESDTEEKPPVEEVEDISSQLETLVLAGDGTGFASRLNDTLEKDENVREITIKFKDGDELCMSSTLLTSICQYFQVMLESGLREAQENVVHLPTVTQATFTRLTTFIFGDQVALETEEAFAELMEAAAMMQVQQLQDACVEALEARLTLQSCWSTFLMIRRFHPTKAERTVSFLLPALESLAEAEERYDVGEDDLGVILQAWGEARIAHRPQGPGTLGGLLDVVRSWMQANHAHPDVAARLVCSIPPAALSEAEIRDHLVDYSSSLIRNQSTRQKIQDHLEREGDVTLLVLGSAQGSGGEGCTDMYISRWNKKGQDWIIPPMPHYLPEDFAFVKDGNSLIISGGINHGSVPSQRVWIVDENGWKKGEDLLTPRGKHGMVMVNGRMFVVGGWPGPLRSIERHSPWKTDGGTYQVGNLKEGVYDCAVAHVKDKLLIVGGSGSHGPLNIVQTFHTETHAVEVITLPELAAPDVNLGFTRFLGEMNFPFFLSRSGHLMELAVEDGTVKLQSQVSLTDFNNQVPFAGVLDSGEVVVCDTAGGFCSRYCRHSGTLLDKTQIRKPRPDMQVHGVFWFFLPSKWRRIKDVALQQAEN